MPSFEEYLAARNAPPKRAAAARRAPAGRAQRGQALCSTKGAVLTVTLADGTLRDRQLSALELRKITGILDVLAGTTPRTQSTGATTSQAAAKLTALDAVGTRPDDSRKLSELINSAIETLPNCTDEKKRIAVQRLIHATPKGTRDKVRGSTRIDSCYKPMY
jgi:hypothetical protein